MTRTIRVLLLEDDPDDAALILHRLGRSIDADFAIDHVTHLADAVARARSTPYDAIVTDLSVPDCSGAETVLSLRDAAPRVPLVVVTASEDDTVRLEVLRLGAEDFVPKQGYAKHDLTRGLLLAVERGRLEARARRIVEHHGDAALVVDMEGRILFASRAAQSMLNRSGDELEGAELGLPLVGDTPAQVEIFSPPGPGLHAELRSVEIDWDGAPARFVTLRDVTDRDRAIELERRLLHADRLASIGSLAAGVAHEINNPSTFIQANGWTIASECRALVEAVGDLTRSLCDELDEGAAERVRDAIERSGLTARLGDLSVLADESVAGVERISSIVRSLSTFARIDDDAVEEVDPNVVLEDAAKMVRNELRHRGTFELELGDLPALVVDRAKLTQVFVNLLVNAGHALDKGAERSRVAIRSFALEGAIRIQVEDNGAGIAKEKLAKIFEPFFTTKSRERGTGLGLSISADTIDRHGGRIEVHSELGRGTRFTVHLPVPTPLAKPVPAPPMPTIVARARHGRVLLVDDEPGVRRAMRRMMKSAWTVVEAASAAEALDILTRDTAFDAIVCDMMMPEMTGMDLSRQLHALGSPLATRMVFVTGGVFSSEARKFLVEFQPPVLEKPVDRRTLSDALHRIAASDSDAWPITPH